MSTTIDSHSGRRPLPRTRHRSRRRFATIGMALVVAGCVPANGGCTPEDGGAGPAATTPTSGVTTTTGPGADTTTTVVTDPTTTTVVPGGSTTTTPTTTIVPGGRTVGLDDVAVGDCLTTPDADLVHSVQVMNCSDSHHYEMAGTVQLTGTAYPGDSDLMASAYEACQGPFAAHVGVAFWDSALDLTPIIPSASTWDDGDRTVVCLVNNVDVVPLTGSVADSAR